MARARATQPSLPAGASRSDKLQLVCQASAGLAEVSGGTQVPTKLVCCSLDHALARQAIGFSLPAAGIAITVALP